MKIPSKPLNWKIRATKSIVKKQPESTKRPKLLISIPLMEENIPSAKKEVKQREQSNCQSKRSLTVSIDMEEEKPTAI
jgi:hypothetical protein